MSDKPQNIFNDPEFFEGYYALRGQSDNLNVLIEQPEIKKLIPDVSGKRVLDLGCGYGTNCAEFAAAGASRVVGVDLSEKMLSVARSEHGGENITFLQMDMNDVDRIDGKFDLIFSSLAFHYVEDFGAFSKKLYGKLDGGGILLFSQEHPLNTAGDDGFNYDGNGNAVSFNLRDYALEGKRKVDWIVQGVEKYHRTFSGILNPLIEAGFKIQKLVETTPSKEAIAIRPRVVKHFIRPIYLLVLAKKD